MRSLVIVVLSSMLLAGAVLAGICSFDARAADVSGFASSNGGCMGMVAVDGGEEIETPLVGEPGVGADADAVVEPPEIEEGLCDYDATGVLWCKQNGVLLSNCAELEDGSAECPN